MKLLLAGGAGFIGSYLATQLIEEGYDYDVMDLLWFGNNLPEGTKVINKDIFKCQEEDLQGYDQVIFLAGLSNDPMAEYNPALNFISNGALPSYLAYIAKRAGVRRFIYASSCSIYGYAVNKLYTEEDPVTCDYPYGISKLQGERGVMQLKSDEFSVIALRQGTVCGWSPRMRFDLIVNTMFKTSVKDQKIIVNNPSIWRPIYGIHDCAHAYIRAVQADLSISGVYNVTSDNFTVGQVAEIVKDEVERLYNKKIKLEIKNIQDFRNYKVSIEKAKTELGFCPQTSINDIVSEISNHYESYGDFEDDNFYNIRKFKEINLSY
ncbi:MAG: NAD(P)-dependent oxidoreductase [Candidatus Kapabacteria bacterium]|nr:NAD(P)-dependent oxidoreductase [Candidatus Kapabacteria bacterium]